MAALFNLLPIYQLDGGRALHCALAMVLDIDKVGRISAAISLVCTTFLLAVGLMILLLSGWNFTLLAVALWLLVSYCKKGGNTIRYAVAEYSSANEQ